MTITHAETPRIYRIRDLELLLKSSRNTVYAITRQDDFPQAFTLTERGDLRWVAAEVEEWLKNRPRAPRRAHVRIAPTAGQ